MKKRTHILLFATVLLMGSVSFCRADSSPPTKEPKTEIVATLTSEFNATVFDQAQLVEKNEVIQNNDAKTFTLNGVWNSPTEKATYVVVGRVPVPSWRSELNNLSSNIETENYNYTSGEKPFIYQKGTQTFYQYGAV